MGPDPAIYRRGTKVEGDQRERRQKEIEGFVISLWILAL